MKNSELHLSTEPLPFLHYEECILHSEVNQHTKLTLKGLISEELIHEFMDAAEQNLNLHYKNDDIEFFWVGIIQEISIKRFAGGTKAEVIVLGKTIEADRSPYTRSIQGDSLSLKEIANHLHDAAFKNFYGQVANTSLYNNWLIQYEETNWQLMNRLASQNNIPLFIDDWDGQLELYAGFQNNNETYQLGPHDYVEMNTRQIKLSSFPLHNKDFLKQPSTTFHIVGEKLQIEGKPYTIVARTLHLHQFSSFQVDYVLVVENKWKSNQPQHPIEGRTFRGIVVNTKDPEHLGRVAVCLPWENENDVINRFLPWATPFATKEIGFHTLPELHEIVFVMFPTCEVEDVFVYLTERTMSNERLTNDMQYWRTADGTQIALSKHLLTLSIPHPETQETKRHIVLKENELEIHFDGRQIKLDSQKLLVNDDKHQIEMNEQGIHLTTDENTKIQIQPNHIVFKNEKQLIELSENGIVIKGTNLTIEANEIKADATELTATAKSGIKLSSQNTTIECSQIEMKSRNISMG
ncbi:hypothetical protein SAMN05880501_105172 [Ureibacillus xyleni]|uniref:Gp5/Type VI secretion system Vgr protein OB-fold domain-containing protein n=1 Tax=Ureibacillus xyleni TaxID=614648 RepID=A0A285SM07_9BACL|nr:phage baseplate assembly protein V [Ureibacillus xyleni]SOC09049.1 hypothetical protein SAMN05880501_105172 [Ureibacillus xyleni]